MNIKYPAKYFVDAFVMLSLVAGFVMLNLFEGDEIQRIGKLLGFLGLGVAGFVILAYFSRDANEDDHGEQ